MADAADQGLDVFLVGRAGDDRELVAAAAGDQLVLAHGVGDRLGDDAQRLVADRVRVLVVDALETLEVEHHDGDPAVAALGFAQAALDPFVERAQV